MKIKKLASLALAVVLAATALTGCGNSSDDPNAKTSSVGYPDEDGYAEGNLGDTMHTEFFDFTVNSAYTCASYEDYIPMDGHQMLIAELTIKNTFSESIPITIYLEAGKTVGANMFPDQYELAKKESRTGILAFEVPVGETQFNISYQTVFEDESTGNMFFVFFSAKEQ